VPPGKLGKDDLGLQAQRTAQMGPVAARADLSARRPQAFDTRYILHRMKRLPDQPHRVARGVFAGSLIGFLPLPGLQFVGAWIAARLVQGNLLAALLATFNTNPITTPFFAVLAMTLGHWIWASTSR
jgi:uncharacterized protein (DUF2062 family)